MSWEKFEEILQKLGPNPFEVSLQGEGEPTAHPQFWQMVDRLIALGHQPYIITNASLIDAHLANRNFLSIGVSIDTLDEAEAHRIGRYKLKNVLRRVQDLVEVMGASRVIVHTVAYGQDLGPVSEFVRSLGAKHFIQPIQSKPDYATHYGKETPIKFWKYKTRCRYLELPLMRYFAVDGREAPCCYIKDMSNFESADRLKIELASRRVPGSCVGCREIATPQLKLPARRI